MTNVVTRTLRRRAAGAVLVVVTSASCLNIACRQNNDILAGLASSDPQTRKQGAWAAIDHPNPALRQRMVAGVLGDEPIDDVREAFVYALGRIGDSGDMSAVESAIDLDPSGLVRAAAWLAAARMDPEHFRTLAATAKPARDDWDALGIAQARLLLGDPRDVDTLLRLARDGDHAQKVVAARSLTRDLLPLLDSVGQLPLDQPAWDGDTWRPASTDEIARRCAGLPLERLAVDLRQHEAAANRFRRDLARITTGRDRIAHWLFN